MLPKQYRFDLRSNPQFLTTSRRIETPYCRLFVKKTDTTQGAVIISKKSIPLSSDRNALKRRFRAVLLEILTARKNITIVLYGKTSAKNASFQELLGEITKTLPSDRA